jgi:predicted component of type VI protein secretion system
MRLSVQIEFDKTMDLDTPKTDIVVGRNSGNDIVIKHDSISRQHCRIEAQKGVFYITDLGSSNGTFIDGQKIEPQKRMAFLSSQQLTLGKLECEIADGATAAPVEGKVVSSQVSSSGDYTATMRINRIDLARGSGAQVAEKKIRPKGPRNPITNEIQNKKDVPSKDSKRLYIILFIAIAGLVAYFALPYFE